MNALDLLAEWLATPSLNSRQRRELEALGVTREAVHRAGGLGWARISTTGRVYQPGNIGTVMIIMPVWAGPAPSIYQGVENPVLIDMIAWRPDDLARWWYRQGDVELVLGADHLELAHATGWPISFTTTPLDWLRADCRGACLLDHCEARWTTERFAEDQVALQDWWRAAS